MKAPGVSWMVVGLCLIASQTAHGQQTTDLTGADLLRRYAVISYDAEFFARPDGTSRALSRPIINSRTRYFVFQVTDVHEEWVRLAPETDAHAAGATHGHCYEYPTGMGGISLGLWVRRSELERVTTRALIERHDDGSVVWLEPGVVIDRRSKPMVAHVGGEPYLELPVTRAVIDTSYLARRPTGIEPWLTDASFARASRSEVRTAAEAPRRNRARDWRRFEARATVQVAGHDVSVSGHAVLSEYEDARGHRAIIRGRCYEANVRSNPEEVRSYDSVIDLARGAPECPDTTVVQAGAVAYWPSGRVAGRVEHTTPLCAEARPTARRRCFRVGFDPYPGSRAFRICFDRRDSLRTMTPG